MSDLSIIPLQDGFETQLSQDWDGNTGTVYVLSTPSYSPSTQDTYIVVNPGKTNMQIARITSYDSTAKTLTVDSISFYKGIGISSTAQDHTTGSVVIISDNYQFWADIQTAVNSKLDITGGNGLVYATSAARDAALGADGVPTLPYQGIFVTADALFYDYNLGTAQWESRDTGTTPGNASDVASGIIRTDVAPAGIPVALITDNPKYDALAGTSGTPSASNKYVTNDDTATAATADKVARRLAGGNITVVTETTGNSTTNAASTAFVQQELATVQVSVPEQEIPFHVSANTGYATNSQVGTNTTGSVMALVTYHSTTTIEIRRLAKVTGVGQYIVTHSTTLAGTSFNNRPSVAITGSYIYVAVNDNGTGILRRYDIADLANVTSMTISGTAIGTNPSAGFSDGTNLYFYNGTTDQVHKYTISGTTATFDSVITYTSAGVLANGGACSDGTSVWTIVSASGSNTIYKYPLAGGSSTGNAVRFFYTTAYNNPGKLGLSINKSGFLNVHLGCTMESNTAIVASAIKLNAIAQP